MYKRLVILLILPIYALCAELVAIKPASKKYQLSVCAIFKNEAKYLKEWIEYHRLVGVDHFYLYNNNSSDHYKRVLLPYIKKGVVTLVQWPDCLRDYSEEAAYMWALSTQIAAYENAIKVKAGQETEWLVFLDVNEFLVPGEKSTFREILEQNKDKVGITFAIDCFNASEYLSALPRHMVIESSELTYDDMMNPQKEVLKTIFRPNACKGFLWPPYQCVFTNDQASAHVEKTQLRINRYTHRIDSLFYTNVKRKLDIDSRSLSEYQLASLLKQGFEIEDRERAIGRFVPDLMKTMGLDSGWRMIEGGK